MIRTWARILTTILLSVAGALAGSPDRTRVYIVVVDGLDARLASAVTMPHLWQLAHETAVFYPQGRSAMLSVTNTNHTSLATGVWAAAHGIVGNKLMLDGAVVPSENARGLETETLVTVAERERPELVTAVVVGKSRLTSLFAAVPDHQLAPDVSWGDPETESEAFDPARGFASDRRTMDQVLRTIEHDDPDFLLVNLPDVDRTAHLTGPTSAETARAVATADAQLQRLVDALHRRGTWEHTVLFVTADHGMTAVTPDPSAGRNYPLVPLGRQLAQAGIRDLSLLANGPAASVFVGSARDRDAVRRRVRAVAQALPEVAEALYLQPNPRDGGRAFTLAARHPDWRVEHTRVGDVLVIAREGYHFAEPFSPRIAGLSGDHGGPDQRAIPIVVTGGDTRIGRRVVGDAEPTATNPDVGATAGWLLGLRPVRATSGAEVPAGLRGRVLGEAFTPAP